MEHVSSPFSLGGSERGKNQLFHISASMHLKKKSSRKIVRREISYIKCSIQNFRSGDGKSRTGEERVKDSNSPPHNNVVRGAYLSVISHLDISLEKNFSGKNCSSFNLLP